MRFLKITAFCLVLTLAACSRPAENSQATATAATTMQPAGTPASTPDPGGCPSQFYYYNQEKITLKMKPHFLIVAFQPGTSAATKTSFLQQFPEYETTSQEQATTAMPFQVVKLRNGTTCAQALPLLEKLKAAPEVLYANPVFNAPATLGAGTAWIGLTSEFLVNIKPGTAAALKAMAAQTNTKIVDELGETTFLLQATKTSQGNALEMANLFKEQAFVTSAEPDFYVAAESGGLQRN